MAASTPTTAIAEGQLGPIEGLIGDEVVFGRYRRDGCYAPELIDRLCGLLTDPKGDGTLIDVGAHIGLVSIAVAERSGARCLSFEPAPDNARLLERNVARLRLSERIEVHACALDEHAGEAMLALSSDNSGDHHLAAAATSASVRVPVRTLDGVLAQRTLQAPVVLKLDTQGAEARVLRGARASLPRIDHAIVEYWPFGLHRIGESPRALDALLCEAFPFAAVLEAGSMRHQLASTADELHRLRWIARDGSDQGFFDLLLSRSAQLTAGRRETSAQR